MYIPQHKTKSRSGHVRAKLDRMDREFAMLIGTMLILVPLAYLAGIWVATA